MKYLSRIVRMLHVARNNLVFIIRSKAANKRLSFAHRCHMALGLLILLAFAPDINCLEKNNKGPIIQRNLEYAVLLEQETQDSLNEIKQLLGIKISLVV